MTNDGTGIAATPEAAAGAAVYSRFILSIYDLEVLGIELPLVFGCPARRIVELYDRHVSERHLDVGVGTGYFLDRCRFPVERPEVHLLDLNPNCLARTAARIRRYGPRSHRVNILEPIREQLPRFGSIALSNVLHCLPGTMLEKGKALANLRPLLQDGGVLFGATVLGKGVEATGALYRAANRAYNKRKIFTNLEDGAAELEQVLAGSFARHSVEVVGSMALFVAHA